jgi:hypothetical protein
MHRIAYSGHSIQVMVESMAEDDTIADAIGEIAGVKA